MKKNSFDNFDEFASNYRQIHNQSIQLSGADSDYFSWYKTDIVFKFERSSQIHHILDLGCGDGTTTRFLSNYFPNASIYGIDVSENSISVAKSKTKEGCSVSYQVYDGTQIPFEDHAFDIVFISMVMHHIAPSLHSNFLREAKRVLKKSGKVYCFEHNPYNPLTRKVVRDCPFDKDAILLNPKYAKNIFLTSGFREVSLNFTLFFPRLKVFYPFITIESFLSFIPLGAQYYIKATV